MVQWYVFIPVYCIIQNKYFIGNHVDSSHYWQNVNFKYELTISCKLDTYSFLTLRLYTFIGRGVFNSLIKGQKINIYLWKGFSVFLALFAVYCLYCLMCSTSYVNPTLQMLQLYHILGCFLKKSVFWTHGSEIISEKKGGVGVYPSPTPLSNVGLSYMIYTSYSYTIQFHTTQPSQWKNVKWSPGLAIDQLWVVPVYHSFIVLVLHVLTISWLGQIIVLHSVYWSCNILMKKLAQITKMSQIMTD